MNISCANCGLVWDSAYLRYDEPHEIVSHHPSAKGMDFQQIQGLAMKFSGQLDRGWKAAFKSAGWEFAGHSLYELLHCPACPGGLSEQRADRGPAVVPDESERYQKKINEESSELQLELW